MMKHLAYVSLCLIATLGMAACEPAVKLQQRPEVTLPQKEAFKLNVASVRGYSKYKAPKKLPNVDHLFSTTLSQALAQWGKDRLKSAGQFSTARFTILDASVVEQKLKIDDSVVANFARQQSRRYNARIEATVEVFDITGSRKAFATAVSTHSVTVGENSSKKERQAAWRRMVGPLMKDFDRKMTKNIKQYLADWIK